MKISYKWLADYIRSGLGVDEIASILTDIGLEVDSIDKIESVRGGLNGVVVGHVLTCEDHPDSDHLHITTVDVGGQILNIVCGAPNVAAGQKVLVATVGAVLWPVGADEPFKIKKSKIRGVESFGMICAEDELGIGNAHDGIMILPPDAVTGTPAAQFLNISDDYVIEIGLTPNRSDAMSHFGVARDVAAYLKANALACELSLPDVPEVPETALPQANITVLAQDAAPRYAGVFIDNVKVAPSPDWLQNRLRAIGLNPKNNIVDITNFVLHELGQPLHAFDSDKIRNRKIEVRYCPDGTPFTTLDGVERKLSSQDLMICDSEKPLCMAGVMGGNDSGVSDTTCSIFLESAYFNPVVIRKTARRHGINSDASFRFERGIDPNITLFALKRALALILEYAGGSVSSGVADIISVPQITEPFRFQFRRSRLNSLAGKTIPARQADTILEALDVAVESRSEDDDVLSVAVPPYRTDVRREVDLIEDILRIYGYNNIEIPVSLRSSIEPDNKSGKEPVTNIVANLLTDNGFSEIMSNSLTKASYYDNLTSYPAKNCVRILNPLSADLNVMRQTLMFNALEAVSLNTNHRNPNLKLYEFGNVYRFDEDDSTDSALKRYSENYRLAVVMTGLDTLPSWNEKSMPISFYNLRAVLESILKRFGINIYSLDSEPAPRDMFADGLTLKLNGRTLCSFGSVSAAIKKSFGLNADVFYLEMDFDLFVRSVRNHSVKVVDLPRFPEVRRDLALIVDRDVTFATLRSIAFATEKKLLRSVTLFDVYEGKNIPEGKKSYALGFILQDNEKTLTDQIIDRVMNNLLKQFERQTGASVRG